MSKYCDLTKLSESNDISLRYADIPPFLKEAISRAVREVNPFRVYAFGSRVRGDFHQTSDIDLAFDLDEKSSNWPRFSLEEPDRIRTLLSVDLVNLNDASSELRHYILTNRIVIYDRTIKI